MSQESKAPVSPEVKSAAINGIAVVVAAAIGFYAANQGGQKELRVVESRHVDRFSPVTMEPIPEFYREKDENWRLRLNAVPFTGNCFSDDPATIRKVTFVPVASTRREYEPGKPKPADLKTGQHDGNIITFWIDEKGVGISD